MFWIQARCQHFFKHKFYYWAYYFSNILIVTIASKLFIFFVSGNSIFVEFECQNKLYKWQIPRLCFKSISPHWKSLGGVVIQTVECMLSLKTIGVCDCFHSGDVSDDFSLGLNTNTRLREHLSWRVDSVNSPCRSKMVSFLKVANAATIDLFKKRHSVARGGSVLTSPRGARAGEC